MRALTICQPYAAFIVAGRKLVENRRWAVSYRGPLLIHAGKNREWLRDYGDLPNADKLDFGAIIGVVDLVACLVYDEINDSTCPEEYQFLRNHIHTEGPFCWVLENARRFADPLPYRGSQGLWHGPNEIIPGP